MNTIRRQKVIQLKNQTVKYENYKFISAEATNTRLMGVIGLAIYWRIDKKILCQLFHLDAEEYGIDDYHSILVDKLDEYEIEKKKMKMFGGLGGEFVSLNERQARYLVYAFSEKNNEFSFKLPNREEYEFILNNKPNMNEAEIENTLNKICVDIISNNQLINYFIMRKVGMDDIGSKYLAANTIEYKLVSEPSVLIKNTIEKVSKYKYRCRSIIDSQEKYNIVISQIKIDDSTKQYKVSDAKVEEVIQITGEEANLNLVKKEFISTYDIKNRELFIESLDLLKPQAMKTRYNSGYLYTEFNQNNRHVDSDIYLLSNDIYALYYVTKENELVIATYDEENIEKIYSYFSQDKFKEILDLKYSLDINNSVIYSFINSESVQFFDFLETL